MSYRIVARIKNYASDKFVGYVVVNMANQGIQRYTTAKLIEVMKSGGKLENAELRGEKIVITDGSEDKLGLYSTDWRLRKDSMTVLTKYVDANKKPVKFELMDVRGRRCVMLTEDAINFIKLYQSSNAKIVKRGNTEVISAIRGTFNTVPVDKLVTLKPHTKNVADLFDKVLREKIGYSFSYWSVSALSNNERFNELMTVSSVNEVRGRLPVFYNWLISPNLLLVKTEDVTSKKAFSILVDSHLESPIKTAKEKLNKYKEKVDKYTNKLNLINELFEKSDEIVARKKRGEYLTNEEFKVYYSVTHPEEDAYSQSHIQQYYKKRISVNKKRYRKEARFLKGCQIMSTIEVPFFKEYLKRGKIEYCIKYGQNYEFFRKIVKKPSDLITYLDDLTALVVLQRCEENKYYVKEKHISIKHFNNLKAKYNL